MKKLIIVAICAAGMVCGFAQGTVLHANLGGGVVAPIVDHNGLQPNSDQVTATLLIDGAPALSAGAPIMGTVNTAPGFWNAGGFEVDGVAAGASINASVSFVDSTEAVAWTVTSAPFTISLGGAGTPPSPASGLVGFTAPDAGDWVQVPEPSTIALALLGAGALFLRRRK